MIAIPKPPQRRKRPDPPWPIDAHASIFAQIDQASGQYLRHPSTLQLPSPDPFSFGGSRSGPSSAFGSSGVGTKNASELKYSLFLNFEFGNLNRFPIAFETVVIRFDYAPIPRSDWDVVEQATIFTESGRFVCNFSYECVNFRKSPSGEKPMQLQVESRELIGLPAFPLGAVRELEQPCATRFILQFFHREVAVSRPIVASIPHGVPIPVRDLGQHGVAPFQGFPVHFSQF